MICHMNKRRTISGKIRMSNSINSKQNTGFQIRKIEQPIFINLSKNLIY